ncbi:MAG: Ig-like domain-containing protein, partial [Thermaerobacter sp.]|nr:Ig-like domain-containing protein [Thermaerobacter sp.]
MLKKRLWTKGLVVLSGVALLFLQFSPLAFTQSASVAEVVVTASPASVPADGQTASTLTAQVLGAGGVALSGVAVSFSTNLGTVASPASGTTDSQGEVSATVYSGTPGTATVTATANGVAGTATVDFYPTDAASVRVSASPSSVPADGTPSTVTAQVLNGNGAPVAGVAVSFSTNSGQLSTPTAGVTNAQGEVTDTVYSTAPGTAALITATAANGKSGSTTVSFYTLAPTQVQMGPGPGYQTVATGTWATVTATVLDGGGQPVAGTLVTFATTLGTMGRPSGVTNTQGQVSDTVYSGTVGQAAVTATADGVSGTENVGFYLAAVTNVDVWASGPVYGGYVPADGTPTTVNAVVTNGEGAGVAGVQVTFATNFGTLTGTTGTTNSGGEVTTTVYSNAVGTATVTATAGGVTGTTQVVFYSLVPNKVQVDVPWQAPADGQTTVKVTATVTDAAGFNIPGVPLTLTTSLGVLGEPTTRTTDQYGAVSDTVYSSVSGTATITATTPGGVLGSAGLDFYPVQQPSSVTVWPPEESVPADGSDSTLTAYVRNAGGQPVAGVTVTWTTTLGSFATATTQVTNAQGEVSATVYSNTVGTATITATADGVSGTTPVDFYSTGVASFWNVSAAPGDVPADGTPSTVTAVVMNGGNQPVSGADVTFTTTLGTLSRASGVTNSQGEVSTTVYSDTAGVATVTAATAGISDTTQVTFYSLVPNRVQVSPWPWPVPADGQSTATVRAYVQDAAGYYLSGVPVTFSTSLGVLGQPTTLLTNASGEVSDTVYSLRAGTATITAALAGGIWNTGKVQFYQVNQAGSVSVWPSGSTPADGTTPSIVTAQVLNAGYQPVPGVAVTWTTSLGSFTASTTQVTNAQGEVTAAVYSSQAGTATVTATAGAASGSAQITFYSMVADNVQAAASPGTVLGDGRSTSTVTAYVTDAAGYMLSGVPVTFSTSLGTLGQPTTLQTNAQGQVSDTVYSATAGIAVVSAAAGGVSGSAQVTFGSPVPVTVQAVQTSPVETLQKCGLFGCNIFTVLLPVPADGQNTATVTTTVLDAAGFPVPRVPVTFSTSLGVLGQPATLQTNAAGQVSDTVYSSTAGTALVTATAGGVSGSTSVSFFSVVPAVVQAQAVPSEVPADGRSTATVTATVLDAAGIPIPGAAVSFRTTLGALEQSEMQVTDAAGQATNAVFSAAVGTTTVTVTAGGISANVQVTFGPLVAATVQVFADPSEVPADGQSTATVTVQVLDSAHFPAAAVPVTFHTDLGGLGLPVTLQTNAVGQVSETVYSSAVGTATVTATAGTVTGSAQVNFYSLVPAGVQMQASLDNVPADGQSTTTVAAWVYDAAGYPVPGAAVTFATSLGGLGQATTLKTNAEGQVTNTVYSSTVGTAVVTATAGAVSGSTQITFSPPVPATVQVSASAVKVPADGQSTVTVEATVKDAAGFPVPGVPVTFQTSLGVLEQPVTLLTNAGGRVSETVYSSAVGTATVTATAGSASGSVQITFTPLAPAAVFMLESTDALLADGQSTSAVTATVLDAAYLPVAGAPVSFTTDLGGLEQPAIQVTNAAGQVSNAVYSNTPGTATVTAAVYGITGSVQIIFGSLVPARVGVRQTAPMGGLCNPAGCENFLLPVPANGQSTATVTAYVMDAADLSLPGVAVTFHTSLGGLEQPAIEKTNSGGQVSVNVYSSTAGTATLTATAGGISDSAPVDFYPTAVPANVELGATPPTVLYNGQSMATVTATVTDAGGIPLPEVPVTFSTDFGVLGPPTTGVTNELGQVSVNVYSSVAGTATVTATTGNGKSGNTRVTFLPVTKYLLFTSDPSLASGSVWGSTLPGDTCGGTGCGSPAGQTLPWTFARATFMVNLKSGDVYLGGSADAGYNIAVSFANIARMPSPTDTAGFFSPTSGSVIDMNQSVDGFAVPPPPPCWFVCSFLLENARTVTVSLVAPKGSSNYGTGNIYLYVVGGTQIHDLSTSPAAAVTLGNATGMVGQTVSVPLTLQAAPLPVNNLTVGAGESMSFDPSALRFGGIQGVSGTAVEWDTAPTPSTLQFSLSDPSGLTAGTQAASMSFTCLSPGTTTVKFAGGQYSTWQAWWSAGNLPESKGQVTCEAPGGSPIGISGFTPGSVPEAAPGSGAGVNMAVTGWGLNTAQSVELISQDGGQSVVGTVSGTVYAGSLTVAFPAVPLGAYRVEVMGTGGAQALSAQDFLITPGIPLFSVQQEAFWSMIAGTPYNHTWTVANRGPVPGVALVMVKFPAGVTATACAGTDVSYLDSQAALVAVPVAAGSSANFCFQEVLPGDQVLGPNGPVPGSANVPNGSMIATKTLLVGSLTPQQWDGLQGQSAVALLASGLADTVNLDAAYAQEVNQLPDATSYLTVLDAAVPAFDPNAAAVGADTVLNTSAFAWYATLLSGAENTGLFIGGVAAALAICAIPLPEAQSLMQALMEALAKKLAEQGAKDITSNPYYQKGMEIGHIACVAKDCAPIVLGLFTGPGEAVIGPLDLVPCAMGISSEAIAVGSNPGIPGNAWDPNSLAVSPPGTGSGEYVLNGQTLGVQVHFENLPTATAPAINVRVDVQLGPNLDPNTVQMQYYSTPTPPVMSVTPSGLIRFYFYNIDLPPDINPPAGEGLVQFQVAPYPNLADNATLTVGANVYFNANPPVATNT